MEQPLKIKAEKRVSRIFFIIFLGLQEKGLLQKSVESRLSTALFVSEDFKLEKTITR